MSYTKLVQLWCDGPECRKSVIAETAEAARHQAKYGTGWFSVRKYGIDTCSSSCDEAYWKNLTEQNKLAELEAEVPSGTIAEAAPS